MDVHKMLEQVKAGQLDIAEAEAKLKDLPYEDLGYAKLDHHRKLRSGFGETIFCQGKPDPYLKEIFLKFYERDGEVLGTRASQAQYELIRSLVPAAVYDPISRIVKVEKPDKELVGCVAVCTGGTADIAVAGMEGALGTVIAGLADAPVIAVPTSVGYGASFHGLSALLTMINSCANGISVVNIDNGYGAGYIATQINRMAVKK